MVEVQRRRSVTERRAALRECFGHQVILSLYFFVIIRATTHKTVSSSASMIWVLFLLLNAKVVLGTCYQNSGYFDKVCSDQKGILLFVVVMMQIQGAAVTCQPITYK